MRELIKNMLDKACTDRSYSSYESGYIQALLDSYAAICREENIRYNKEDI